MQITVESEDSVNILKEQTKDTNVIAPKDIEIVVSKMKGDEIKHVFNSSTVSCMSTVSNMSTLSSMSIGI